MKRFFYLFRKNFIIVLTISSYILSVYFFFFDAKILFWLLFAFVFFLFVHYFLIELKKTQETNLLLVVWVVTLFLLFVNGFGNFFYVLWIILFNVWVFFLLWTIYDEIYNRINISSYKLFTRWIKIYTLFLSLTFAVAFLWTYRTFDLTCNQISSLTSQFSDYTIRMFWFDIQSIWKTSIKDVLDYIWKNNWLADMISWWKLDNLSWSILSWYDLTWTIINWENNMENSFEWVHNITFSSFLNTDFYKSIIFNQIMENKQILNDNICELVVWKIKEKYQDFKFQFSVMFLFFVLFYPLIRLVLFVFSLINLIFFKLMNLMKIYKFKTVVDDVEIIE